jgi:hypothetical protein
MANTYETIVDKKFLGSDGVGRLWTKIRDRFDGKLDEVLAKDNSIAIQDGNKVGVKISPKTGNQIQLLNTSGEEGLFIAPGAAQDTYSIVKDTTSSDYSAVYHLQRTPNGTGTPVDVGAAINIPKDMVRVIPKRLYDDFDAETSKVVRMSASMACTGRFSSFAQLILGIKTIHTSAAWGLVIQTVSILLGFGLCMMLILSKAFEFDYLYMSSTVMVIYNLIFTAVTYAAVSYNKI